LKRSEGGGDNAGTIGITDCGTGQLVPNGLHVSSYGFNATINGYLYYFPVKANEGGQNTW
jgi:hypothetical protein